MWQNTSVFAQAMYFPMRQNNLEFTDRIIRQGRAIESLTTISPFKRAIAGLLVAAYKRRLRGIPRLGGRGDPERQ